MLKTVVIAGLRAGSGACPACVLKELTDKLVEKGIEVKYAIHLAGWTTLGHMNVLLGPEAEVSTTWSTKWTTSTASSVSRRGVLVLGANDVEPGREERSEVADRGHADFIEAYKARTVIVNKRSMAAATLSTTTWFYMDKTMMVFGDAKKVIEEMVMAVE